MVIEMKKFQFGLEPILKYKNDLLEVSKNEHANAAKKVADQENLIYRLEMEKKQVNQQFNQRKQEGMTIAEAAAFERYNLKQTGVIRTEEKKLDQLKRHEEEKKEKMIEAKKDVLSIEKLKSIREEEYRKECQKENELFIEEFVSNERQRMSSRL